MATWPKQKNESEVRVVRAEPAFILMLDGGNPVVDHYSGRGAMEIAAYRNFTPECRDRMHHAVLVQEEYDP